MRHVSNEIGKRYITEDVEQPNQVVIRTVGEMETSKYFGILEADTKQTQKKKKKLKRESQKTRKFLKTKLYSRNLVKGENTWAIPPRKILVTILEMDPRRT